MRLALLRSTIIRMAGKETPWPTIMIIPLVWHMLEDPKAPCLDRMARRVTLLDCQAAHRASSALSCHICNQNVGQAIADHSFTHS